MLFVLAAVFLCCGTVAAQQPDSYAPADSSEFEQMVQGAPMMPGWQTRVLPQNAWQVSPPDFEKLLSIVSGQTFASNQLPMIQAAGLCGWFTCSQCAALMNIFDFDDNKLKVVEYLAPHLIDPIRCQPIIEQLSFISDRQKAWRIISAASL